jgi:ribosomal protein L12E/L44/L45/RPP1/RPP2
MVRQSPASKAFNILKKNLTEQDLRELVNIIGIYLEEKWQLDLAREIETQEEEESNGNV